jgi:hypothetical protein
MLCTPLFFVLLYPEKSQMDCCEFFCCLIGLTAIVVHHIPLNEKPSSMALVDYSTRLLRLSSNNKTKPTDSNSDFTVSFSNFGSQLGDKLQGISIEGISFPNYALNIPADHASLTFVLYGNTAYPPLFNNPINNITITIPTGFYTDAQLAAALNTAFLPYAGNPIVPSNTFSWTVIPNATLDVNYQNLALQLPISGLGDNWNNGGAIAFQPSGTSLGQPIGIIPNMDDGTFTLQLHGAPVNPQDALFRTNLQGPSQLFLHSTKLTQGKLGLSAQSSIGSFQGLVNTFTALGSIPMEGVLFGQQVCYQPIGDLRPWVAWHRASHMDLSFLDVSLRDHHGNVVDLGAGELNVVLRLWYNNHL